MRTLFSTKLSDGVQCLLCPHTCKLQEQEWGRCGARQNLNNEVIAKNYAKVAAVALDPIEKKPLFHFYPGKSILSIGTFGCNFNCAFCQNWHLARGEEMGEILLPQRLAQLACEYKKEESIGVAYTYSEPLMWYEYVKDSAFQIKEKGLKNVLVTNGFINSKPLSELLPLIDAANIDVKSYNKEFYHKVVGGDINIVLRNAELFKEAGVHVEITFLLVTSLNDSYDETKSLVKWIKEYLGKDTPLHISRYFPNYKLDLPATPLENMEQAYLTAKEELSYVYLGNVENKEARETKCPSCGQTIISRSGYQTVVKSLKGNLCENCNSEISGVFEKR